VLPDLVPVPNENGSFCNKTDGGRSFIVTVKNQGTVVAGLFTTEVDFYKYGKSGMSTTAMLDAGDLVQLKFLIPPGCHDPDCEFKITVDVDDVVVESDEGNNVAIDTCLG